MNFKLEGKVIVVTGGASGIGERICKELAAEGAIPCIVDRDQEKLVRVVQEIKKSGKIAYDFVAELSEPAACKDAVEKILLQVGRIDGLVNNAGLNDGVGLEEGDYNSFVLSLHRNIVHYYLMTELLLPFLKETQGAIVNIISKVFETGQGGTSGYAASNGMKSELTEKWADEFSQFGVRVNGIVVAECWTPQYEWWISREPDPEKKKKEIAANIPFEKRFTTTKEIADMAVFLLSEKSAGITGQLMHVDGGYVHLDRKINHPLE